MSDVPRSLQRWVSTIQIVIFTADVFQLRKKNYRMTMETRCFKAIFPKHPKKWNRLKIRSYRRQGEHREKMFVFLGLIVHAAVLVRGGTCAFTFENRQHADQKLLTYKEWYVAYISYSLMLGVSHVEVCISARFVGGGVRFHSVVFLI